MAPGQNFQALSFIGKTVMVDNGKVSRADTESQHAIRFNLPADAPTIKAQVKDAAGTVVRNLELKSLKSGKNEINWNGNTDDERWRLPVNTRSRSKLSVPMVASFSWKQKPRALSAVSTSRRADLS